MLLITFLKFYAAFHNSQSVKVEKKVGANFKGAFLAPLLATKDKRNEIVP